MDYNAHLDILIKSKAKYLDECGFVPQCVLDKIQKIEDRISKDHFDLIYNKMYDTESARIRNDKCISDIITKISSECTELTSLEDLKKSIVSLQKTKSIPKITGLNTQKIQLFLNEYKTQFQTNEFRNWLSTRVKCPKNSFRTSRQVFNSDSTSDSEDSTT
jgi:hypothetical protein